MRIIPLMFLATVLALAGTALRAADQTGVRAMLVIASNQRGASDPKLAAYEPTLRSILRFESYRLAGSGSATLSSGKSSIDLGHGHSLILEAEPANGKGVGLRVRWEDGGRTLMNTGLSLRGGVPAVLGGPSTGKEGEVWAVIIVAN